MKIDDLNTINALNTLPVESSSGKENANVQKDNIKVPQQDRVALTTRKTEIEKLAKTVGELPDVRSDKVAALKQAIEDGSYRVDGAKVAEKMIKNFNGLKDSGGAE
jgi:negative regulator of flagellin synthesis FlgM